jgi:hypothetical protein
MLPCSTTAMNASICLSLSIPSFQFAMSDHFSEHSVPGLRLSGAYHL